MEAEPSLEGPGGRGVEAVGREGRGGQQLHLHYPKGPGSREPGLLCHSFLGRQAAVGRAVGTPARSPRPPQSWLGQHSSPGDALPALGPAPPSTMRILTSGALGVLPTLPFSASCVPSPHPRPFAGEPLPPGSNPGHSQAKCSCPSDPSGHSLWGWCGRSGCGGFLG